MGSHQLAMGHPRPWKANRSKRKVSRRTTYPMQSPEVGIAATVSPPPRIEQLLAIDTCLAFWAELSWTRISRTREVSPVFGSVARDRKVAIATGHLVRTVFQLAYLHPEPGRFSPARSLHLNGVGNTVPGELPDALAAHHPDRRFLPTTMYSAAT